MKHSNNVMIKFLIMITTTVIICMCCFNAQAVISITNGPTVRIPGITTPTVLRALSTRSNVRWLFNSQVVGNGATISITLSGHYYAEENTSNNPDLPRWISLDDIEIPGLVHGATTSGQVQLCLSSNASAYVTAISWKTGAQFDGNHQSCRAVSLPGMYAVSVTYTYGAQSATLVTPSLAYLPVPLITSDGGNTLTYEDPVIQLSTLSASGVGYTWYFNDQPIQGATSPVLNISNPGNYTVKTCITFQNGTSQCKTSSPQSFEGALTFVNCVMTKKPIVEGILNQTQLDTLNFSQSKTAIAYLDGFARPIQQVQKAASPQGKDVVMLNKYDAFGRELKKFLPFTRSGNDGGYYFIPNTLNPLLSFYQRENDKIANTAYPFSESLFESSPLNRLLRQGAPGEEWQLSTQHVKSFSYANNKTSDNIWIWNSNTQGLSASAFYPDGSLSKIESTDENGHTKVEFRDKLNQVILSEALIEGGVKLRTYFVYDDLGRLSHVVPPKTIASLPVTPTATLTNDVITRECFSYKYDERSRIIVKNIPGAGSIYLVYDQWDRVVLTQQANQRARKKWSFNKYDAFDRIIMTGEVNLQGDQTAATTAVKNFYVLVSSNLSLRYEEAGNDKHGYTNRSFPILLNEFEAFVINYYDDYRFLSAFGSGYQFDQQALPGLGNNYPFVQRLITGVKMMILGTHTYLKNVRYYDVRHRPIQIIAENHLGGIDRISSLFDFTGKILKEKMEHHGEQTVTITKESLYDHSERLLKTYHTVNNGPKILLCDYQYNELGQLVEKNIHSRDGNTFLQSLDYTYNIRGWLEQFNPIESPDLNATFGDLYSFVLSFTTSPGSISNFQPSFNGNISAFTEIRASHVDNGASFPFISTFAFQYDARDQLKQANYYQLSNRTKDGNYDMPQITYDANGNILSLKRKGIVDGVSGPVPGLIDDLTYFYSGNQLIRVDDAGHQVKGFTNK